MNPSDLLDRIALLESRLLKIEDHLGISEEQIESIEDVIEDVTTTTDLVTKINADDLTMGSDTGEPDQVDLA